MTLYIARNGEKLGPMSLAQAQEMVRNGTVSATDFAWYEGLATWIPLNQVPGFAGGAAGVAGAAGPAGFPAATLPQPERPVGVWIICILYFICVPCSAMFLIANPVIHQMTANQMNEMQRKLYEAQGLWNYYLPSALNLALSLAWSIQLFRLKRNSIYIYIASLVIGLIGSGIRLFDPAYQEYFHQMLNMSPIVTACFYAGVGLGLAIAFGLLAYNWYLIRKGVLR